ncbi:MULTISPECIES: TM2 domain-containing protein [Chryseobacterium]|uniref:TM2 domain-containing protein n=1 Tax=Chryseobacterium TaxID=59732 RepID=UPI001553370F|nr:MULTISPECIES: TM2 domain-containing protein [unclassified Chryseobacterium]MDC8105915.1 TM2 domain-containing protein [Chryseobacterium sp. B21-037]WBV55127.1 TM2 domain-containing protein [Chryseobacterium daecheongense]
MKSKFTTAMLALFLGGLGIHRFYLGQNTLGIFYLLFCWTFIPALIAFIDFIVFIFMSENSFNYKYNLTTGF